ncbi:MAG: tRNA-dihydrouridine synthase family protein [Euryarchaeota archaeon]|nr:tRNA-dihydrouridine synthase family protein [Euryarchaeota archaeon]
MREPLHPMEIGDVRLPNNLVLSPMAGFSDLPFRVLCRRHGAGLVSSEMVAAGAVAAFGGGEAAAREHKKKRALARMLTCAEERPTSIQLFGTDPVSLAAAAKEAERDCEILGFNMGCPAWQIKNQGCGAALLDHPEKAEDLVTAIKSASRKPLLVKLRAGNTGRIDVASLGRRLEAAGADAFILHARTAAQGYGGKADWTVVRDFKDGVGVPVLLNGDVVDGPSASRALLKSGADGIALGRGTLGDPHVFRRIAHFLATGHELPAPTAAERLLDFQEYARMALEIGLPRQHVLEQANQFTRGLRGATKMRAGWQRGATVEKVLRDFEAFVDGRLVTAL